VIVIAAMMFVVPRSRTCPGASSFTSVGYGAYEVTNGPGGHQYLYNDVRKAVRGITPAALPTANSLSSTTTAMSWGSLWDWL
jgi:hypothetical protein